MKAIYEKDEWNSFLEKYFPQFDDTYFRYEYFEIYKNNYGLEPESIFWDDGNISIFFPHLIRSIGKLEIFKGMDYFDLTTPYGYGGPLIILKTDREEDIYNSLSEFKSNYINFAQENNYISEFIRFHPIFETWKYFHQIFNVQHLTDTVAIDLTKNVEELTSQLSKNTRRYLKKSHEEFNRIIIVQHPSDEEFEIFRSLYNETMKHQNAPEKYFFSDDFIMDHFHLLNSLFIYCQNTKEETGSIALFFKSNKILHYHLGATNYNFSTSPLRTVLWEAAMWAKKNDCTLMHLGGGLSVNDSLFQFKRGFSKKTYPFYVGKVNFNDKIYKNLVQLNPDIIENDHFFPLYRKGTLKNIVE